MQMRELGRTGRKVSELSLGTMTFGEQTSEADGHAQLDLALEAGINLIDTAEVYAIPPRPETAGKTEEIIGRWLSERKSRDKVVIATKVAGRSEMSWLRKDKIPTRLDKAQIHEAIEGSLRRLKTDHIDLYQVHWPDRKMVLFGAAGPNYLHHEEDFHPIEETVEILSGLVKAGKVRHIGVSNETPWGVMKYLAAADAGKGERIVSIQNAYSLVNRTYEMGLSEITHREGVGLLTYSSLAQGYLTGKYLDGKLPVGSRKERFNRLQRYERPGAETAMSKYVGIARKHGLDPVQMALAFVLTKPFVTSLILGARELGQLKNELKAHDLKLSEDVLKEIEAVHVLHSNPCP